jgi:(p)ppGpp synthase/HD superfamily hydrolase
MELQQVFVFTPRGDVKVLPHGATPLDFAYAVHSDIGNTCMGAKANGKIVPLDYQLKSGDFCEILTRKNGVPKPGWIKLVHTARARSKIRRYLREQGLEDEI